MKYSRTILVFSLSASIVISGGAASGQSLGDQHDRDGQRAWVLSSAGLPGLFGGIGLKLDDRHVLWIAAQAENPADNNRTFIYDVRTRMFRETAPVPAVKPLDGVVGAGVLSDGTVLVTGGEVLDPSTSVPNPKNVLTYRYDPRSNRWSRTGDLPEPQEWIFTPSTLLRDGRLLLAGGRGLPELATGTTSRHAFVYDAFRKSVVRAMDPQTGLPSGRTTVVQGKWDYTRTRDGQISDMAGGHLFGNLVQLHDGRVLVAGGHSFWALPEGGNGAWIPGYVENPVSIEATDTEFFDPSTGRWSEGAPLPVVAGEDDAISNSHGGRANGVCLAALPDDRVVIAGGGTHPDGTPPFNELLTRSSIVVMTPARDARNSTYQISPNAIPSVDNGRFFGDAGRNQLPCYVTSRGKVLFAGGVNNAGECLFDSYLFDPRTDGLLRAPDLAHSLALWGPSAGYPDGYEDGVICTQEVSMRDSHLVFHGDVFVMGGGADGVSLDPGSHQVEQLGSLSRWDG